VPRNRQEVQSESDLIC